MLKEILILLCGSIMVLGHYDLRQMKIGAWISNSGEGTRQNGTVTSGEGALVRVKYLLRKPMPVEDTRPLRLFIKNTALCKHESGRIGCDK